MEELLYKIVPYVWIEAYGIGFANLKLRIVTTLILLFRIAVRSFKYMWIPWKKARRQTGSPTKGRRKTGSQNLLC